MTYKKKPYKTRKIFCRKSGGGKFRMSGRKGGGSGGRFFSKPTRNENQVKSILERIGFRVGKRGD